MTPQGISPHVQADLLKRELKALGVQQGVAEYGIELMSGVSADLSEIDKGLIDPPQRITIAALVALVSLRLHELQTQHEAIAARTKEIEATIAQLESPIARPVRR